MKWVIDRFEGNFAVVESEGAYFNIPKDIVPSDAKEGSILEISINAEETEKKEIELKKRIKKLFGE